MKKYLFILLLTLPILPLQMSAASADSISIQEVTVDSVPVKPVKKNILQKASDAAEAILGYINDVDTLYIRPQEYNWAVMLQSTTTIEAYKFRNPNSETISFAPEARTKIGPYAGWRWAFLGYTFDIKKLHISDRVDVNLSFYSSIFNIDLIWRESGKDYKINDAEIMTNQGIQHLQGITFPGLDTYARGMNFNYVLKHRKFSYPAAFSQSTCQLRSAGSPIVGISYMHHKLRFNSDELENTLNYELDRRFPEQNLKVSLDSTFYFKKIEHAALTFSGGYAYNYVLGKNLIFGSSLTMGVGFKRSIGDTYNRTFSYEDFKLSNVNFDGCGRFALVYNNMKWFTGLSSVIYYYSYNKLKFHTSNLLTTINLYVGFNFGKRKK